MGNRELNKIEKETLWNVHSITDPFSTYLDDEIRTMNESEYGYVRKIETVCFDAWLWLTSGFKELSKHTREKLC